MKNLTEQQQITLEAIIGTVLIAGIWLGLVILL